MRTCLSKAFFSANVGACSDGYDTKHRTAMHAPSKKAAATARRFEGILKHREHGHILQSLPCAFAHGES